MKLLDSPIGVTVGTAELEASVTFWSALGFRPGPRSDLDAVRAAALYGLDGPQQICRLTAPGCERGWIELVSTPLDQAEPHPYRRGPLAIDLYSRDLSASVVAAAAGGGTVGAAVCFPAGPTLVHQVMAHAPEGTPVVFVQVAHRLPSALDADPDRLHSELHSVVWSVDGIDAATDGWLALGLRTHSRFTATVEQVATLMGLPRVTPISMAVLADEQAAPLRFELFAFGEDSGPDRPARPLRPGSFVPVFVAARRARQALLDAGLRLVGEHEDAAALLGPGDVELQVQWF